MKLIRRGTADYVLAGGFDSMIHPIGLASFCLLGALSPDNETPERASRPFDATRNGFVLGEGAGLLVLEEWSAAPPARGANLRRAGRDGNSLSSYRITDSQSLRRRPDPGDAPGPRDGRRPAGGGGLPERPRHVHPHERSERVRGRPAVFGAHAGQIGVSSDEEPHGPPDRGGRRGRGGVCALAIHRGVLPVNANLADAGPGVRSRLRARRAPGAADPGRPLQLLRLRRLQQLPRPAESGRGRRVSVRIVVTGTGAICAAGKSPGEIWDAVWTGRSAIRPIQQWDASVWPTSLAGEIAGIGSARPGGGSQAPPAAPAQRPPRAVRGRPGPRRFRIRRLPRGAGAAAAGTVNDRTGVYVGMGGAATRTSTSSSRFSPPRTEIRGLRP